jgi:predicted permease
MPVIIWTGSWLTFKLYSLWRPMDIATRTALTLVAGLGNTSFLGFPLVTAYFGESALPIAVISDQVSFVILATLASIMAMSSSPSEKISTGDILKKLVLFPPFVAFCLALILPHIVDFTPINPLFDKISATLVPLALFSVGMQLSLEGWREELPLISLSLGYKLIIAPALILGLVVTLKMHGIIPQISVFEAAMAPMITAGVLAAQYDLNPRLANLVVGIGILLSFITTGLWWWILQYIPAHITTCTGL